VRADRREAGQPRDVRHHEVESRRPSAPRGTLVPWIGRWSLGVAGIVGTLTAPLVAGRVQRKAAKEDRVYAERIAVYVELLEVSGQVADNFMTWSAIPLADLPEPETERMRAMYARVRVVGSDPVYRAMKEVSDLTSQFVRDLLPARGLHARVREDGTAVDTPETIKARMDLGKIADATTKAVMALEAAVRKEMSP
jgi:hypothetical protein